MSTLSATYTIIAQPSLAGMCACRWAGYWYWFSRGAPDGPAETA